MSFASLGAAGNSQGTAAQIATTDVVVTGADGTKGVILPADASEATVCLHNTGGAGGTNALPVYPPSGGAIDSGSTNASVSVAGKSSAIFRRLTTNVWMRA